MRTEDRLEPLAPDTLVINARPYRMPRRPTVAITIDGCDPRYIDDALSRGLMPRLAEMLRSGGHYGVGLGQMPSFTNTNNMSIVTGGPPIVHGLPGNHYLAPSGEEAGPAYRSHLIDRDPAKFPLGSCLFANLTPHPVRVTLGGQKLEIAAGADLVAKPDAAAGEVIAVTVECQIDGHWQAVSSSRLAQRNDRRSLVTLHLAPRTGRVLMKSIPLREAGNTP